MRTFILFAALFILALQAQAKSFPAEQVIDQVLEQRQQGEENQDIAISFDGVESSGLPDADARSGAVCRCTRGLCSFPEREIGACVYRGMVFRFCCRA